MSAPPNLPLRTLARMSLQSPATHGGQVVCNVNTLENHP
ncbi:rCG48842 [Rattus norvegicus]|uniref:RCG48842 n=1 Tax=Rattus norvegicus TaxID=10116 RepID=A6IGY1_RAT|nr:rCG48842 [Rattus norvegicus]